jgi:hypothetical protein
VHLVSSVSGELLNGRRIQSSYVCGIIRTIQTSVGSEAGGDRLDFLIGGRATLRSLAFCGCSFVGVGAWVILYSRAVRGVELGWNKVRIFTHVIVAYPNLFQHAAVE